MTREEAIARVEDEIAPLTEKGYSVTEAMLILKRAQRHVTSERKARGYGYASAAALDAHLQSLAEISLQERTMRDGASAGIA